MANPDRNGGGGLSLRTLAIASAASMTAAMVVSRLFPPGTLYAAALTPVIVAAVSEMLNRPVSRLTELREQRRTMVLEAERAGIYGDEPGPLRGAPEFAQGAEAAEELATNGSGDAPPVRVYGRERSGGLVTAARRVHPKVWLATGLVAFAVAVAALTLPELIFGGAVASEERTTFFGGSDTSEPEQKVETQTTPEPVETVTETVPSQSPPTDTDTATEPTPTATETTPAPSGGAPAPSETGTTTTPGGAVPALP